MAKDYVLRDEYSKWLPKNGVGEDAAKSYQTAFVNDNYIEPTTNTEYKYVDIIGSFVLTHDVFYAITYLDLLHDRLFTNNNESQENASTKKTQYNKVSYFNKYKEFILSLPSLRTKSTRLPDNVLNQIKSTTPRLTQFDAMDPLITAIGSTKALIKLAIENSIFFDKEAAEIRFVMMANFLKTGTLVDDPHIPNCNPKALYARKSTSKHRQDPKSGALCFYEDKGSTNQICQVEDDSTGNAKVNKMIEHTFGYGPKVTDFFKNYVISHIWGQAVDPRFFTSLWNLALIPAWANHLMDKTGPSAVSIASMLLDTVKAISTKHYGMNNFTWCDLKLTKPQCGNSVMHDTYKIRVLRPNGGSGFGKIDLVTITV
jgi:hypothetical protein